MNRLPPDYNNQYFEAGCSENNAHNQSVTASTGDISPVLAKKVTFYKNTIDNEGKQKIQKRDIEIVSNEKESRVSIMTNKIQRREILHYLSLGTQKHLENFSHLFKASQCSTNENELEELMRSVSQQKKSLSIDALNYILKTYLVTKICQYTRLAANYYRLGTDEKWYFLFSLEALSQCKIVNFSKEEVERAKKEVAAEIASDYDTKLPENWKDLPSVSLQLFEKKQQDEQEKKVAKEEAEKLFPAFETALFQQLEREIRPELEQHLKDNIELKPEDFPLNTLNDAFCDIGASIDPMARISEFIENRHASSEIPHMEEVKMELVRLFEFKFPQH